jgi:hypothetical protein
VKLTPAFQLRVELENDLTLLASVDADDGPEAAEQWRLLRPGPEHYVVHRGGVDIVG